MALTSSQISSKLFKKSLGAGETIVTRQFFEEPKLGRDLVLYEQIWSQSNLIPNTAPSLSPGASAGVVQYFQLDALSHVPGSLNLSYFSSNLVDSIPFNFGDGTYNYQLYKNDGVTSIAFGQGDWIVDNTSGLLTFYGTLPSGVSDVLPPKISFYKYVGSKGFGSESGIGTILGVTAGNGLSGGGTAGYINLDVNLGNNSGLTFSGDNIVIWDRISGSGLTFSNGVLDVNVNSDSLEITGDSIRLKDTILGNKTFQDSLTIGGNLTVNGTVSYVQTENLYVEDNIITLNATFSGSPLLNAGIEVIRGLSPSAALLWDETLDLWVAGLSGSTSVIITEAGVGLTKSGNTLSADLSGLAGIGLSNNGTSIDVNVGNGLSIVSDFVYLGGTLSQDTTINANDFDFTISGADNITFTSSTFDVIANGLVSIDAGVGSVQILGDDDVDVISVNGDISLTAVYNLLINATSSSIAISDGRGLVYSDDYSSSFVTHSLVTKKYVDSGTSSLWNAINSINSVPVYEKKISLLTTGNNQPTGFTLSYVPNDYSRIEIFVNGQIQYLGDGTSVGVDCYFWNGSSVVQLNNLVTGNELYWNGGITGFDLTSNDTIYVIYEK